MTGTTTGRRYGVNAGSAIKVPCKAATTSNITLSGEQTIDGVSCTEDDRVLVKNQTDTTENGIYNVSSGTWQRAPDWDGAIDVVEGTLVPVNDGTLNSETIWRQTTSGTITPGTTGVGFTATTIETATTIVVNADNTGTTVVTSAIQSSLNIAGSQSYGGAVYLPPGNYKIDGTLAIPEGVKFWSDGICDLDEPGNKGATIYVTHTGTPAVTMLDGCQLDGINFFYPDQDPTDATPTVYDYCIELDLTSESVQGVDIIDCVIHNAHKGINLGGSVGGNIPGNTHITRCRMFCLHTNIHVGYTLVNLFCEHTTISPEFWLASAGQNARTWAIENGIGLHYEQGTGIYLTDLAVFGLNRGVYVDGGALTFFKMSNCIIDGCRQCVVTASAGTIQGGTITGGTIAPKNGLDDTDDSCVGLFLSETTSVDKLIVSGTYFAPGNGNHVQIVDTPTAVQSIVILSACTFENANTSNNAGTHYNIFTNNTLLTLLVDGCLFKNNTTDVFCIKCTNVRDVTINASKFYSSHDTAIDLTTVGRNAIVTSNWSASSTSQSIFVGTVSGSFRIESNIWDTIPSRLITAQSAIALSEYHKYYQIDGTNDINTITGGYPDRMITLKWTHATPGDLTTAGNVDLRGGTLSPVQNDTVSLIYDGSNWQLIGTSI